MREFNLGFRFPEFHSRTSDHERPPRSRAEVQTKWWVTACASLMVWVATAVALPAQTFTTLHAFDYTDGYAPSTTLLQASDGKLYGTTFGGGTGFIPAGTIFKITTAGALTSVYSFCSQPNCSDGDFTYSGLVQATNGKFYGVAGSGGTGYGGTVYELSSAGDFTTLYAFCSQSGCADGGAPTASLVQGTDGNFYGTTNEGGQYGFGTAYKITPAGRLTTLHDFCSENGCADGGEPFSTLILGGDGSLYGVTVRGGAYGGGTVFRLTPQGSLSTLYSFCAQPGCADGSVPNGLVQSNDGSFYGTTGAGGTSGACTGGCGEAFRLTPQGIYTPLYSFCSKNGCTDGEFPESALVQATDGNFYGMTYQGGAHNAGTIFKLTTAGTLTTLYSFCSQPGCADGSSPIFESLIQDTNGKLYGVTGGGGYYGGSCATYGCGTVFSVSVGLHPFVETQPTSGPVGQPVKVLGTNLTGATGVTFNGTAAQFTVVSPSFITTTVPAGATTGYVQVTTPKGTLKSNVQFRVKL